MSKEPMPNIEQNESYLEAFDHFNERLFDGQLPRPMLVFSRSQKIICGTFAPDVWKDSSDPENKIHEIALNCNIMEYDQDITFIMNVLVHEMIHLWQHEYGNPTRAGYHNKEYAAKAESLGLEVYAQDKSGNRLKKKTGQSVNTERIEGGVFDEALNALPEDALFPWVSDDIDESKPPEGDEGEKEDKQDKDQGEKKESKQGKKSKYTCANCGLNAWAKPEASIMCGDCVMCMTEQVNR